MSFPFPLWVDVYSSGRQIVYRSEDMISFATYPTGFYKVSNSHWAMSLSGSAVTELTQCQVLTAMWCVRGERSPMGNIN